MGHSLKWVAAATMIMIVLVVSTLLVLSYSGIIALSSEPLPGQPTPTPIASVPASAYKVTSDVVVSNNYNNSAITPTNVVYTIWKDAACTQQLNTVTADGSDQLAYTVSSGQTIVYFSIDNAATTVMYVDTAKTVASTSGLTYIGARDIDNDGVKEYVFALDVSSASGALSGGQTTKPVDISVWAWKADVTGLGFNTGTAGNFTASTLSGSTIVHAITTNYMTGVSEGGAFAISKITVVLPNAANSTYFTAGKVSNVKLAINGQTYILDDTNYDTGTYTWTVYEAPAGLKDFPNAQMVFYNDVGSPPIYATDLGKATWTMDASDFDASGVLQGTLTVNYVTPAGVGSGTITAIMTLTDT